MNSSEDDLRLLASNRIEQSAVPLAIEVFPPVTKEPFLVTANDQVCTVNYPKSYIVHPPNLSNSIIFEY